MSGAAVKLDGVTKAYGRVQALDGLSFDVAAGRFFVLFGPSAVGKTTTLRAISGLTALDGGRIDIGGVDVTLAPIAGRGVSMVFQSFALYPHLTVAQNFAYPLVEAGVARAEISTRVTEIAAMLKLSARLDRKPNTLSGGEQQRVALGRSLIRRPQVLLLDEPLTNLDAKLRHDMRAELKRLHRQLGMTIIYATPDELEALSMGEEIAVMREGRLVQRGTPDELYDTPANTYVAGKIGSPPINLVKGELSAKVIELPFGSLPLTRKAAAGQVIAGLRPQDIRLATGRSRSMAGVITLLEPLGDITVVDFEAGGIRLKMVLPEQSADRMKEGDALSFAIEPERIHLFNAADGQALA